MSKYMWTSGARSCLPHVSQAFSADCGLFAKTTLGSIFLWTRLLLHSNKIWRWLNHTENRKFETGTWIVAGLQYNTLQLIASLWNANYHSWVQRQDKVLTTVLSYINHQLNRRLTMSSQWDFQKFRIQYIKADCRSQLLKVGTLCVWTVDFRQKSVVINILN